MTDEDIESYDQRKRFNWAKAVPFFLLILVLIVASLYFIYWSSQYPPRRASLLARDWEEIWFTTSTDTSVPAEEVTFATNQAGGGAIEGQTQFMRSWPGNFLSEYPYVTSISEMHVNDVVITVFDLTEFDGAATFFDDGRPDYEALFIEPTFDYGMGFSRAEDGVLALIYTPFKVIPPEILDTTIYHSANPISLTVKLPSRTNLEGFPTWELITDEPTFWTWNLRRDCSVTLNRLVEIQREIRDPIWIVQNCSKENDYTLEANESPSQGAIIDIQAGTVLLNLEAYQVYVDGNRVSSDNGRHLVLIEAKPNSPSFLLQIELTDAVTHLQIAPEIVSKQNERDALVLFPSLAANAIGIRGATGKLAVGIDSFTIDELSEVLLQYKTVQPISIVDRIVVDENGTQRSNQFLSIEGDMITLSTNGEELITSRWGQLPPDVQGGIIGATIASFFTLIGWLGSSWISERRPQPVPPQPIIHLNPTFQLPPQSPSQSEESNGWINRIKAFIRHF